MLSKEFVNNFRESFRAIAVTLLSAATPLLGVGIFLWYNKEISNLLTSLPLSLAGLIVILLGAILSGLALLPTHAISLASGWLFGSITGSFIAIASVTVASAISFLFSRKAAGAGLLSTIERYPRLKTVHGSILKGDLFQAATLIALARVSPAVPFAATNVALTAIGTPFRVYLFGSMIGLAPRIVLASFIGAQMAKFQLSSISSPHLLIIGTVTAIVALILGGRIAYKALSSNSTDKERDYPPAYSL